MAYKLLLPVALISMLALGTATLWDHSPLVTRGSAMSAAAALPPALTAEVAIVVDDGTRQVLYAKAPHRRVAPASLTKMVTAIVALERGRLTDLVTVDIDSELLVAETESSVMGLMPGDELTMEQLLYGLLLPSGNDAAIAIARHIAGSERGFVEMMNRKVKEIGLKDTRFANSHGLDDENHYSTAYDMAIIARYAMQNTTIARMAGTLRTKARISEEKEFELYNGNPLIGKYRGADGVKPGYTDEAQQALAVTAKRGNRRIYAVIIRSDDMVKDASNLLDYYFPRPVLISPRTTILFPLRTPGAQ